MRTCRFNSGSPPTLTLPHEGGGNQEVAAFFSFLLDGGRSGWGWDRREAVKEVRPHA